MYDTWIKKFLENKEQLLRIKKDKPTTVATMKNNKISTDYECKKDKWSAKSLRAITANPIYKPLPINLRLTTRGSLNKL